MPPERKAKLVPFVVGLAAGAAAGGLVWLIASKAIDKQFADTGRRLIQQGEAELRRTLSSELNARVPPLVRSELTNTLRDYGITPETGTRISRLLERADRIGLI